MKFAAKLIFRLSLVIIILTSSHATLGAPNEPPTDRYSCNQEQCIKEAEGWGIVLGLIALTVGPPFLVKNDLKSNRISTGHVIFGGLLNNTKLAEMNFHVDSINETPFGGQTNLALTEMSGERLTSLRYQIGGNYTVFNADRSLMKIGTSLAAERVFEIKNDRLGPSLDLSGYTNLTSTWWGRAQMSAFGFLRPIYRARVEGIYIPISVRSAFTRLTFGYEYESNLLDYRHSNYIFLGILFHSNFSE